MNQLDNRIRAFVGELLDSSPIAPPFPGVTPEPVRQPGPRRRRLVLAIVTGVVLVATVLVLIADQHGTRRVQVNQVPTTTTAPGDALAFREVRGILPYRGGATPSSSKGGTASASTSCEDGALVTPRAKQTARDSVVLPDRSHSTCYLLGPTLLTGHDISTADAVIDPTIAEWTVNLHFANNDFVAKVAVPYVGRQIAIVLNGVVESAPTINSGITGQDVTISGQFDEATAKGIASSLAPPSAHASDTTSVDPNN
jgi:hypothetical protein